MQGTGLPFLSSWQNFTIIIGAAAATLTGLMFVVITLMSRIEGQVSTMNAALSAFNTPTVTHFCAVLLLAGILSAPWPAFSSLGILLGLVGLGAVIYMITVIRHMRHVRHVSGYQPPLKDWLWYVITPLLAYIILIGAAIALPAVPARALYAIGAVMMALLFIGIHNAWDLVTYLAVDRSHPESNRQD